MSTMAIKTQRRCARFYSYEVTCCCVWTYGCAPVHQGGAHQCGLVLSVASVARSYECAPLSRTDDGRVIPWALSLFRRVDSGIPRSRAAFLFTQ